LSDIHFRAFGGSPSVDIERAVRDRILADIKLMRQQLGRMDAVLVVGDIAATGKRTEYEVASRFLRDVCSSVDAPESSVVCVAGNHDLDWAAHTPLHAAVRHQLRTLEPAALSDTLLHLLQTKDGAETILRPIANYNDFAIAYGCDVRADALLWAPKSVPFGTRSLVIHGVTSAWICDGQDSLEQDSTKVVAGLFQFASVGSTDDEISIALCHHPTNWLRDGDVIRPWLIQAHVVLTGHEHAAGIELSGDSRSVSIASGAVNPNRDESPWIPTYNVIELSEAGDSSFKITVHSRSWQRKAGRAEFGPDEERPKPWSVELPIGANAPPRADSKVPPVLKAPPAVELASDDQRLLYFVMAASPDVRRRAARELGLVSAETSGSDADRALLAAAIQNGRLAELKERIERG
jgi:predicted phosphodiesterase